MDNLGVPMGTVILGNHHMGLKMAVIIPLIMAMFIGKMIENNYFQANPNFETDKSLVGGLEHVFFPICWEE
jgi:hypothetical protein